VSVANTTTIATRRHPPGRWVEVPIDENILIVRSNRPGHVLSEGRHRVRRVFQSHPELYFHSVRPFPIFLWITDLYTIEGKTINLSWKLTVEIVDVVSLWERWLQYHVADSISGPDTNISARMVDSVQEWVKRLSLEALRTDLDVRRRLGGDLSLKVRGELKSYGLDIAAQPDHQSLRFQTEADIIAAQIERETLKRMAEDAKLQTTINRIDNAEVLQQRLREWMQEQGRDLSDAALQAIISELIGNDNNSSLLHILERKEEEKVPDEAGTPEIVDLEESVHGGRWHVLHHLSHFILISTALGALVLAAIAIFEPGMLATPDQRTRTAGIVAGTAFLGLFVAWMIDQIMRWEARQSARRMLAKAKINHDDEEVNRLEVRHLFVLLGAMIALAAAAVALWLPNLYPWLRLGGSGVGLFGAVVAIRYDWLRNLEQAHHEVQTARRRIAGAQLSAAQRKRIHIELKKDLVTETQVALDYLEKAGQSAFYDMRQRSVAASIRRQQQKLTDLLPKMQELQEASQESYAEDAAGLAGRIDALHEETHRCSNLTQAVQWSVQRSDATSASARLVDLDQCIMKVQALLTRWNGRI